SWVKRPLLTLMKIRARDGLHTFQCEYQNQPSNPETAIFAEYVDSAYYRTLPHDVVFYGAVDPSLGKLGKGRDPSAILVGGYQRSTGTLYVVEARIKKRVPSLIIEEVIELQKQYGCLVWSVETVQFQEFFKEELVKESGKRGIHVPARGVKPTAEKILRIESIQPHLMNGFIKILPEHRVLINQLREFPDCDHDDGLDALQMLWAVAVGSTAPIEWHSTADDDFDDREFQSKWAR
ncbi:MAG: phage terminase large subunit, partial [Alysiella sp.]|uniref:phage terminase large subunit n=1 Tax=Alysiella sp. TaxID=1872483 RepID=UPI0026DCB725